MLRRLIFASRPVPPRFRTARTWLNEVKYGGYRLRVDCNGDRVRLITRNGYDWTRRFPWIVAGARKNRASQFVIDGEAVILGVDGVSDFDALHSGKHNDEAQLYAFDVLAMDGEDLRDLPLSMRRASLARLLPGWPDGMPPQLATSRSLLIPHAAPARCRANSANTRPRRTAQQFLVRPGRARLWRHQQEFAKPFRPSLSMYASTPEALRQHR
jgi:hypothetical protein